MDTWLFALNFVVTLASAIMVGKCSQTGRLNNLLLPQHSANIPSTFGVNPCSHANRCKYYTTSEPFTYYVYMLERFTIHSFSIPSCNIRGQGFCCSRCQLSSGVSRYFNRCRSSKVNRLADKFGVSECNAPCRRWLDSDYRASFIRTSPRAVDAILSHSTRRCYLNNDSFPWHTRRVPKKAEA